MGGTKKRRKKASTSFSSAWNTRKTYGVRSHAAIARLGHVIVNTVTCCYSRRLATGLNAVILTHFCAMSWQKVKSVSRLFASNSLCYALCLNTLCCFLILISHVCAKYVHVEGGVLEAAL